MNFAWTNVSELPEGLFHAAFGVPRMRASVCSVVKTATGVPAKFFNEPKVWRDREENREPPLLEQRHREVLAPLRRLRHAVLLQLQVRAIRNA